MNQLITSSQIEFVISKILPVNKNPELDGFTWEFYQPYEEKMILTLLKLFKKKLKRKEHSQIYSMRPPLLFPGGSDGKESACNARDQGLIPGSRRSPGEGNGYLLQYSCLGHSMDRGAWRATVYGVAESEATEQLTLSFYHYSYTKSKQRYCKNRKLQANMFDEHR